MPPKKMPPHEAVKDSSLVSDIYKKARNTSAIFAVNSYAKDFSPKDNFGNLLTADNGEVVGVEDGQPLFKKDGMETTVHAAPIDAEDKRPEAEQKVFKALKAQFPMSLSSGSFTLKGKSGLIISEQGTEDFLLDADALSAYEALPNNRGMAWIKNHAAIKNARNTAVVPLITPGLKNAVTAAQSETGKAYIANTY